MKLGDTSFKHVSFQNCKMIGLQFSDCRTFLLEMHFKNCTLDYSSFSTLNLKQTTFQMCSLIESDFSSTNLEKVDFKECTLLRATFDRTNLKSADFRTATHYSIDPENNNIDKAKFSLPYALGLLSKYAITIET
jgi:uncharacterized protein YjbI with pentapeptide repeats